MKILIFILLTIISFQTKAVDLDQKKSGKAFNKKPIGAVEIKKSVHIFDHSHKVFTEILKKYVVVKKEGAITQFKYKELKTNPQKLNDYLKTLSSIKKSDYDNWKPPFQQAFLINAYNAFTLKLIIDNYPVKSIKKIGGFFSSPWKKKFFSLLGAKRHLDWIEHDVLRKKFNEPRVHFAVNCASIGCPALRNEAFVADKLDKQLDEQGQLFLNDSSRNYIDRANKKIYLSKIFNWFEEDFEKNGSTVQKFVAPYLTNNTDLRKQMEKFSIKNTDYDWNLNEAK